MLRLNNKTWISLEFKLEDLWIGVFWKSINADYGSILGIVTEDLHIWICIIPCLPIHIIQSHKFKKRWVNE